jgi:hypothetical protein
MSEKPVRVVTAKEMIEFIFSREDGELIDYCKSESSSDCGCLMVEFGKHAGIQFDCVGISSWISVDGPLLRIVAELEDGYCYADFGCRYFEIACGTTTFGKTKEYCRKAFPEFC